MDGLIRFFTLMTMLFAGLGQTESIPARIGYGIAGGCAAVALVLAIVRYRRQKQDEKSAAAQDAPPPPGTSDAGS